MLGLLRCETYVVGGQVEYRVEKADGCDEADGIAQIEKKQHSVSPSVTQTDRHMVVLGF